LRSGQFEGKQFGLDVDEVKTLGSKIGGDDAIVGVTIPRSTFDTLDKTPVDSSVLRHGSVTAREGEQLDLLNSTFKDLRKVD